MFCYSVRTRSLMILVYFFYNLMVVSVLSKSWFRFNFVLIQPAFVLQCDKSNWSWLVFMICAWFGFLCLSGSQLVLVSPGLICSPAGQVSLVRRLWIRPALSLRLQLWSALPQFLTVTVRTNHTGPAWMESIVQVSCSPVRTLRVNRGELYLINELS